MELQRIDGDFSVCKIERIEDADLTREFVFLSVTPDEISLVCETEYAPTNVIAAEIGWKALKVSGVLDFGLIGIIAKISNVLTQAEISIFVVSTYNTDYILLKEAHFDKGVKALELNGYVIV